jgi:uncharacterized protein YcbX
MLEQLWRYPVKSMLGERISAAAVTERGLPLDRRLALIDRETGKVASAKAPRLWRDLLRCAASTGTPDGGPADNGRADAQRAVRIEVPGGKPVWSTDPDVDDRLSAYIGRPVHLSASRPEGASLDRSVPEEVLDSGLDAEVGAGVVQIGSGSPEGSGFFDFAPLHLVTTSTLDRIGALGRRGRAESERYRPNLVIRTGEPEFVENGWLGKEIRIGPHLRLRVIARTPRCAVPTLEHGGLPRDVAALRVLAEHNRVRVMADPDSGTEPCAGVYAQVVTPGRIAEGDEAVIA